MNRTLKKKFNLIIALMGILLLGTSVSRAASVISGSVTVVDGNNFVTSKTIINVQPFNANTFGLANYPTGVSASTSKKLIGGAGVITSVNAGVTTYSVPYTITGVTNGTNYYFSPVLNINGSGSFMDKTANSYPSVGDGYASYSAVTNIANGVTFAWPLSTGNTATAVTAGAGTVTQNFLIDETYVSQGLNGQPNYNGGLQAGTTLNAGVSLYVVAFTDPGYSVRTPANDWGIQNNDVSNLSISTIEDETIGTHLWYVIFADSNGAAMNIANSAGCGGNVPCIQNGDPYLLINGSTIAGGNSDGSLPVGTIAVPGSGLLSGVTFGDTYQWGTPTITPTSTGTITDTPTSTQASTNTLTLTPDPSDTQTTTPSSTPTATSTQVTLTFTSTLDPSDTPTSTSTSTGVNTQVTTDTPTNTLTLTLTPDPSDTPTSTATSTTSDTPLATDTSTSTLSATATTDPSDTSTPTITNTPTVTSVVVSNPLQPGDIGFTGLITNGNGEQAFVSPVSLVGPVTIYLTNMAWDGSGNSGTGLTASTGDTGNFVNTYTGTYSASTSYTGESILQYIVPSGTSLPPWTTVILSGGKTTTGPQLLGGAVTGISGTAGSGVTFIKDSGNQVGDKFIAFQAAGVNLTTGTNPVSAVTGPVTFLGAAIWGGDSWTSSGTPADYFDTWLPPGLTTATATDLSMLFKSYAAIDGVGTNQNAILSCETGSFTAITNVYDWNAIVIGKGSFGLPALAVTACSGVSEIGWSQASTLTSYVLTFTPTPTVSSTPTGTNTLTLSPTVSLSPTMTPTSTLSLTQTVTPDPSDTPTSSSTSTPADTPTITLTPALSFTVTNTFTNSVTPTVNVGPDRYLDFLPHRNFHRYLDSDYQFDPDRDVYGNFNPHNLFNRYDYPYTHHYQYSWRLRGVGGLFSLCSEREQRVFLCSAQRPKR